MGVLINFSGSYSLAQGALDVALTPAGHCLQPVAEPGGIAGATFSFSQYEDIKLRFGLD
ncbi:hypothetical protein [uncultured Desulfobulbus sp.]|uniref:hypothetical protein n=1 Tax=uncultured Desulfobulbus sp. TaxID=239745 RepID=UPI0029C6678A|nr:hypothetical protein [uncultured Desulfobulbus sp.]